MVDAEALLRDQYLAGCSLGERCTEIVSRKQTPSGHAFEWQDRAAQTQVRFLSEAPICICKPLIQQYVKSPAMLSGSGRTPLPHWAVCLPTAQKSIRQSFFVS